MRAKSGLLIETPAETLNLEQFPEQNQADARAYIQHYLAIPEVGANIKSWVAENYQSEAEFCRELVAESGNNFMYLSQVLGAIPPNPPWEGGDRKAGRDVPWNVLTKGLEEYYRSLWRKMAGDGLSEIELGVLRVLVEQEEASVEAIAESIDIDEYDVEEVLESWLEFLHWQEIGGEICYSLYHWSFRKFLRSIIYDF